MKGLSSPLRFFALPRINHVSFAPGTTKDENGSAASVLISRPDSKSWDRYWDLFDIEVLDHLMIGRQRYVSLKERGLEVPVNVVDIPRAWRYRKAESKIHTAPGEMGTNAKYGPLTNSRNCG